MVETKLLKNKEGKPMETKEGKPLTELRFEAGDEFIPSFSKILERTREVEVRGRKQNITNYSLKCTIRNKGRLFKLDGEEEVFVTLTPAQADRFKKRVAEGTEPTQKIWTAYEYESKNYGTQIGIDLKKDFKKPKTFEELESSNTDTPVSER